ncbi:MAG: DNA repair protein RadC [Bacilli bacterium]|nr:DNA repair protein RadC [Bacilli bacterium]MDD3305439.1 DNA repair protein RadC [Bacilli bacterium]MDD4054029.1 DNA repair protein RadC [Bacilli bacterium]MDD4411801.1 DNA repair protein RadC [Bacilli bacterium]
MMIKDIPDNEKPRERMMKYGVENISNEDLLAITIKTGTKSFSSRNIASFILSQINDISELKYFTIAKFTKIKGIGYIKAIELITALELGRRVYYEPQSNIRTKFNNPLSIYEYFRYKINDIKQEYFYCLYLDNKKNLIDYKLLFMGTINMSIVHPREIFKNAYLLSASSIICLHNHPSGNSKPSMEDKKITTNLVEIGKLLGIEVVDHIIISNNDFYSFYENNDM